MIIGNGLIATAMQKIDDKDTIFFASGVSDFMERRESEFDRERELLLNSLDNDKKLIYFSTTPKKINRYMVHKREMEDIVRENVNYSIFRVQYIVGGRGCRTNLFNFLKNNLIKGNEINVFRNVYRTFFDIDDLVRVVEVLKDYQGTITMSGVEMFQVRDIVEMMAAHLGVKPKIKMMYGEPEKIVENDEVIDKWLLHLGIKSPGYVELVIRKYLQNGDK